MIVTLLVCTLAAAFFAGIETGFVAADRYVLSSSTHPGRLSVRAARFLLAKPERLLSTTLIGTNFAVVTVGILVSNIVRTSHYPYLAVPASLTLSIFLLIFSEIIPKTFFRRNANTITIRLAPLLAVFWIIFLPISTVLNLIAGFLLRLMTRGPIQRKKADASRQDLRLLVRLNSAEAGIPEPHQRVVEEIFDFQETMAREVMIHLHDNPLCSINRSVDEIISSALETKSDVIPVCGHHADEIIGYIDVEDLFRSPDSSVESLVKKAPFYPETKRIPHLLLEMNERNASIVFIANEYGRVTGYVTPAHIVSEITGFIPGVPEESPVVRIDGATFHVSGTTDIDDLAVEAGIRIPRGPYDTVGGYLCEKLGQIPVPGTEWSDQGAHYRVIESDERKILSIRVEKR